MNWQLALKLTGLIIGGTGSIAAAAGRLLPERIQRRTTQLGLVVAIAGFMIAIASLISEQRRDAAKANAAALEATKKAEETRQLISNQAETLKQIARALNPLEDMTLRLEVTVDAQQPLLSAYENRLRALVPSEALKAPFVIVSGFKDWQPRLGPEEGEARALLAPSTVLLGLWSQGSDGTPERTGNPDLSISANVAFDWAKAGDIFGPLVTYHPSARTFRVVVPPRPVELGARITFSSLEDFRKAHLQVWLFTKCACDVSIGLQTKHGKTLTATGHKDQISNSFDFRLPDHPWD